MFRSLIRLALAFVTFVLVIPTLLPTTAGFHRGGHRNAAGEWCCGDGDCFVIPKERIMMTGEGYVIIQGPLAGVGPQQYEAVPFSEAQPSPDGEFWRCNVRTERAAASSRRRPQPERSRDPQTSACVRPAPTQRRSGPGSLAVLPAGACYLSPMPALILPLDRADALLLPIRGALIGLDLGTKTIGVASERS